MSSSASRRTLRSSERQREEERQRQRPWQAYIGVAASVSPTNFAAFLLHTASSIVFLVFLNATQPFIIAELGEKERQGSLSGTLIFADELFSMMLALVWGSAADVIGTKPVAVIGYALIALALYAYTLVQHAWPDLLYTRLLFALGGSAVTAMLTGILNSYAAPLISRQERRSFPTNEPSVLLDDDAGEEGRRAEARQSHGKLAALAGLTTGAGALFAVFILLRLPTWLAVQEKDLEEGMRETYYIVSALAVVVALSLSFTLKQDAPSSTSVMANDRAEQADPNGDVEEEPQPVTASAREARRRRMRARLASRQGERQTSSMQRWLRGTIAGFLLCRQDAQLALAYVGSALARASTIATTVFIPLLVTHFFYSSGQCDTVPSPDVPPEELKRRCRQAFVLASILSGVIQLTALLFAPIIGYLCDTLSPARTLFFSSFIATIAYAIMGLALPHGGDPRSLFAWFAAIGIGFGQIGAIVASLALCAKAKSRLALMKNDKSTSTHEERHRTAKAHSSSASGAIAGAYSSVGGLSILFVSTIGGRISDLFAPAPFLLMALLAAFTTIASVAVMVSENRVALH